jgi:PAT family beta-lactamase induction signal transducer AmpG
MSLATCLPACWRSRAGVVIEKFFFGFGSVGFMIYLMQQLAPGKYTTTHYAFGTGLMGCAAW